MATFTAHGVLAAGLYALLARLTMGKRIAVIVTFSAIGFLVGVTPDVLDWFLSLLGVIERWSLYSWFHGIQPTFWWWFVQIGFLGIGLHTVTDLPFHRFPGYNWWPDLWYLEIAMWVVGVAMLWLAFRKLNPDFSGLIADDPYDVEDL